MMLGRTWRAMGIITGLCLGGPLHAQDSGQQSSSPGTMKTHQADKAMVKEFAAVTVAGICESLAASPDTKRNASAVVDFKF
ncbi:hypothetical protein [Dyella silvatica]|uniref:hypothetical protein n=1 Tax=Dyella silvatica TaxID=2992128 RepID=UPI0022528429|nr:hypothetical protein [Dyella silvatica]